MKKLIYTLSLVSLFFTLSCKDDEVEPSALAEKKQLLIGYWEDFGQDVEYIDPINQTTSTQFLGSDGSDFAFDERIYKKYHDRQEMVEKPYTVEEYDGKFFINKDSKPDPGYEIKILDKERLTLIQTWGTPATKKVTYYLWRKK